MNKASILTTLLLLVSFHLTCQDIWTLDKSHSRVGFTVTHNMISEIDGIFHLYDAKIVTYDKDFTDAVFEFSAKTSSIDTDVKERDDYLKKEYGFDVRRYPTLTFNSTKFVRISSEEYRITGDLTIKGVTKSVELELWLIGPQMNDRTQQLEIGVKAKGEIKRLDFGIGTDLPTFTVSDPITLRVLGEFRKTN